MAYEFNISEPTLLRKLKLLTGLLPMQYLQEMRLDRTKHLIEKRSHDSVAKVAAVAGHNDTRSFTRVFKRLTTFLMDFETCLPFKLTEIATNLTDIHTWERSLFYKNRKSKFSLVEVPNFRISIYQISQLKLLQQ